MQEINRKIGQRIQKIRKLKNLTQQSLSEKIGCSVSFLSRIERGVNTGSLKLFVKIAAILNVPLKEFFDFEESDDTAQVEEVIVKIRDKDGAILDNVFKPVKNL